MDLQHSGSGYDQAVHSPLEQNLPHSVTESSREEARTLYYGMKTEKFSPDPDALQLSPHLEPSREENLKELPARKPEISDRQYQSPFTQNIIDMPSNTIVMEVTCASSQLYIARAEEQIERLRALLEEPREQRASVFGNQVKTTTEKFDAAINQDIVDEANQNRKQSPLKEPDNSTAETSSSVTDSASRNRLSQCAPHREPSSTSASSSIEGAGKIQEHPEGYLPSMDIKTRSPEANQNPITQTIMPNIESKVGDREISGADRDRADRDRADRKNGGETAIKDQPQDASTQQGKASILSSLGTSATEGSPLKPRSVTVDSTEVPDQRSAVSKQTAVSSSSATGRQTEDTDQVHSEHLRQASTAPKSSSNTGLSATKTRSLTEPEFHPKNEDDIKKTSQSKIKKKPPFKKRHSGTHILTKFMPCLAPAKPPESRGKDQSTSSQGTAVSADQKKSVKFATSVKPTRFTAIHKEAQKQMEASLNTESASASDPAEPVSGAEKTATVGKPSESSDVLRTRSIKIDFGLRGKYTQYHAETFSPGTTLEVIQKRMNDQIIKFKSSASYRNLFPIRAEISSVVEGFPDSKISRSFDEVRAKKAKHQGSAHSPNYESKTASLFNQLKEAEASDLASTWV